MNYRLIRNVKAKGMFSEFGFPLLFIGALILFHFFYPTVLGSIASRVATPFWNGQRFIFDSLHDAFALFRAKQALTEETKRLSAELAQANALLLDRGILFGENRMLKEQFNRFDGTEKRLIGTVLSTPPRSVYDTMVIDVGEVNGVGQGDSVLSGASVLGTVQKVYTRTSIISFFSTSGRKTPVSILHDGEMIPIEATGEGGGAFSASLPKEVSISEGDPVVMPGLNPLFFAFVEAIEGDTTDSFQRIRFKNPISIQSIRFLEIQKKTTEDVL